MARERIVRYDDERSDDFAASRDSIRPVEVDGGYDYRITGFFRRIASFLLYRVVATPAAFLFCKLALGYRIRNRRTLRGLRGGYFLYGNHTQDVADAFLPTLIAFPRRCDVVTSPNAVSVRGLGAVTALMGAVPLGATLAAKGNFLRSVEERIRAGRAVAVYPEAHIWPWFNGIRDFPDGSFALPRKLKAPAVPYVTVDRRRRLFPDRPPRADVILGPVLRPEDYENRKALRDAAYTWMKETAERERSFAWIEYRKREEP